MLDLPRASRALGLLCVPGMGSRPPGSVLVGILLLTNTPRLLWACMGAYRGGADGGRPGRASLPAAVQTVPSLSLAPLVFVPPSIRMSSPEVSATLLGGGPENLTMSLVLLQDDEGKESSLEAGRGG